MNRLFGLSLIYIYAVIFLVHTKGRQCWTQKKESKEKRKERKFDPEKKEKEKKRTKDERVE